MPVPFHRPNIPNNNRSLSILTKEHILELLAEQPGMLRVPGVALVWLEFSDSKRTELAVAATVYAGEGHGIWRLPVSVAGLPAIVKVQDRHTGRVVEVIDPRKNGAAWPRAPGSKLRCTGR